MKSFSIVFISVLLGALLNIILVNADTNTLLSVTGGKVRTSHVNQYFQALSQDLVPRNSSGVSTDDGGSLGTSSVQWKSANIRTGYWEAGDIKCHHTYNGLLPVGQGWMQMDGRIVNETNYNTEHSAGDWDTYIISSLIDGRFLPQFTNTFIIGVTTTTKDGTIAITPVGNIDNEINLQHTHPINAIQWFIDNPTVDQSFDSSGNVTTIVADTTTVKTGIAFQSDCSLSSQGNHGCIEGNFFTNNTDTQNALSTTQNIKPQSLELVCFMRII